MLFKMILDSASEEERPIARGFLRHIIAGFAIGLVCGGLLFGLMFLMLGKLDLHVPLLFVAAVVVQFGPIGGLIGAGIHVTRITDRGKDDSEDDDEPRGGTKAPVTSVQAPGETRRRKPRSSPVPSPA
jgi:hypothetical protein